MVTDYIAIELILRKLFGEQIAKLQIIGVSFLSRQIGATYALWERSGSTPGMSS